MDATNPYQSPSGDAADKQTQESLSSVQAEIVYTQQHLIDSLDRMHSQHSLRRLWLWLRYAVVAIFGTVGLGCLFAQAFFGALLMMGLIMLCFCSHKIDNFFVKRRFQKSPYRDVKYTIKLSDEGFSAISDLDQSILKWPAFSRVLIFDDGILMQHASGSVNWLPNDSFVPVDGHEIAKALLTAKLTVINAAK